MDIALVTGADAGPGLAIARRLIGMGCRVYALATQFARNPFPHDDFISLTCDLADPAAVTKAAEDILAREGHVTFVVHAARRSPAPLFDTPVAELAARVNTGLLAPLALARATLPALRQEKGHFVVLCWNGDGDAPGGPVTAAIEGGLHHFSDALFDELRNDGVRSTTVYARPNPVTPPEAAMALDPQSAVNPELLADAVESLLRLRASNVVSTLIIRPAATAETPRLARSTELAGITTREVQLPPRHNFPREPEAIPTPPRARPADAPPPSAEDYDDEDDDEIDDWDPEREPLPWVKEGEEPAEGGEDEGEDSRPESGQSDGYREPRQDIHHQNQGHGQQGGRNDGGQGRRGGRRRRGGRGRGRGGRDRYDDRPRNTPPPQGGDHHHGQPQRPQSQYPDAEREAEQRAQARAERFRAPHADAEEEPQFEEPLERGGRDAEDSPPNRDTDFEASPSSAEEEYAPRGEGRREEGSGSSHAPHGGHGPSHSDSSGGHGQRRHRRPGRRPPPGGGRGPGSDA